MMWRFSNRTENVPMSTLLSWLSPPPPRYLYVEVATIHPAPGATGIYTLSEAHFPGARVWLGPPRHLLSPAVYQAVQDACPDVLPVDADPEVRWRLLNHYWPAMPATTPPSLKLAGHLWGDRIP